MYSIFSKDVLLGCMEKHQKLIEEERLLLIETDAIIRAKYFAMLEIEGANVDWNVINTKVKRSLKHEGEVVRKVRKQIEEDPAKVIEKLKKLK